MADSKNFENLFKQFTEALPSGPAALQKDLEKNLRAMFSAALSRMDVVTREEFEIQSEVLARTRARLEALEARVAALEGAVSEKAPGLEITPVTAPESSGEPS